VPLAAVRRSRFVKFFRACFRETALRNRRLSIDHPSGLLRKPKRLCHHELIAATLAPTKSVMGDVCRRWIGQLGPRFSSPLPPHFEKPPLCRHETI
jgi:hypothetical protein